MSLLDYLHRGLLLAGGLNPELEAHVVAVAEAWTHAGVDPAAAEILAEVMARMAHELGDATIDAQTLLSATAFVTPPAPVGNLMQVAAASPLDAQSLAALAVHLVDIVEAMAIEIYVPELPALTAKSDRTGAAARSIGVAKHLRG